MIIKRLIKHLADERRRKSFLKYKLAQLENKELLR